MASDGSSNAIDPSIFDYLKAHGEEELEVGDRLHQITATLNRHISTCQGLLSRIHSTPGSKLPPLLKQIEVDGIKPEVDSVGALAEFASKYPYYNEVPVNLKDRDAFHITIEEYILALTDITEELSRLAMNSVTMGDISLTVRISGFIKDLFAGFQLLNLKNDIVRKRVDAVKYHVKKVEDVIYDLDAASIMALLDPVTMSSPAGKAKAGEVSKPKDSEPPTQAVRIMESPQAQVIRHIHPVLLASLFLARFKALVADPVSTLSSAIPVVMVIQAAYAIACLPAAGSQIAKPAKKIRPGEKKKSGSEGMGPNIAVTTLVALILSATAAVAFHVVLVLFGAPFLTHVAQTFFCSTHMALLGLFPLFYTRGVSSNDWLEILSARAPIDEAFGGLMGACVGAWLGAVPIPLDWDREWQKWPVTILCGIYAGYLAGKALGGTLAFGMRLGSRLD
ncbi:Translin [Hypomontagnella monticulosa]|nr:Translin [Hypomontagnella monticulosa]